MSEESLEKEEANASETPEAGGPSAEQVEKPSDEKGQSENSEGQDSPEGEEKSEDAKSPEASSSSSPDSGVVVFQGKVEIHHEQALPQFDTAGNKAFHAVAKDKAQTGLFAIVCEPTHVPRLVAAKVYSKIINPNMATLVLHGPCFWPPAGAERYVLVYLNNLGKPLVREGEKAALGWNQEEAINIILKPIVNILQDFEDKDFVHGAIRASNLFDAGASGKPTKVMLGDCLSVPPSYAQSAMYETLERAMTDPIARGVGTLSDDLYALGVTLTVCLRNSDSMYELSEDEIVRKKLELGSYAAITGQDRFKGEILELLRGLLHDDPLQRWTVEEMLVWMDGTRLTPKQAFIRSKSARPLEFSGQKYIYPEMLAMDLGKSPADTKRILEDQSLEQWLVRSLEDQEVMERVEEGMSKAAQAAGAGTLEDRLVTSLSAALDPLAPLRYKTLRVMADGIGPGMVEAMVLKQDLKPYHEIIVSGLVLDWLGDNQNPHLDTKALFNKFEQCRRYMRSNKMGEGVERCVYTLAPEAQCLSESLQSYYVTSPGEMVMAFEDMCLKKKAVGLFLDRHCVAFLMNRDSKVVESHVFDLNQSEKHKNIIGNLGCLAAIQKRYSLSDLPGLTNYFATEMASVYERYHDRKVRDKIKKAIEGFAESGDLSKMLAVLDNVDLVNKDAKAYRKALEEFAGLHKEKEELKKKLDDDGSFGVATGREIAAIISSVLAGLIILGVAFMFLSNAAVF